MIGYNFTERVRKVLSLSRDEALRLHHEYVGTEHILLALIREGEGIGVAVIQNLVGDPEQVTQLVKETLKEGRQRTAPVELPYTSRAKKVLELAMMEARELTHSYVGTEHLLLGLLREEKGIAAQVLNHFGLTQKAARAEVLRLIGRPASNDPPSAETNVTGVRVEVRFADGRLAVEEFKSIIDAIRFLGRQ